MLHKSDILKYGGKGAILDYVRKELPDIPIPEYVIVNPSNYLKLEDIWRGCRHLRKPLIVRSSSPYEYANFEGIFDSIKNVNDAHSLINAIETVKKSATSERAQEYSEQNGFEIDDDMRIIIQEQSELPYNGAMMRHPNDPNLIFISYANGNRDTGGNIKYANFLFDEKTRTSKYNKQFKCLGTSEKDANFLVKKYNQIENLKNITKDHNLFVEFGYDPSKSSQNYQFYQTRPFKKIETADFGLPDVDLEDKKNILKTDMVFGITPKEGIVVHIGRSFGSDMADLSNQLLKQMGYVFEGYDTRLSNLLSNASNYKEKNAIILQWNYLLNHSINEPFCLMTDSADISFDVDLSVPHMNALILGEMNKILTHGLMRLVKKADITFFNNDLIYTDFFKKTKSVNDSVRIISNGKEAIAIKE